MKFEYLHYIVVLLLDGAVSHSSVFACSSSIDTSVAECMPGVACCLFAADIPGSNATGPVEYDETVLADKQVCVCVFL